MEKNKIEKKKKEKKHPRIKYFTIYYNGEKLRPSETVYSEEDERKLDEWMNVPENKEAFTKRYLVKNGYIKEPEDDEVYLNKYMVEVITNECNNRMKKGRMAEGTKIGYLANTKYISNYFSDDFKVKDIGINEIQKFLDDFAVTHSKSSLEKATRVLKWTYIKAVEDKIVEENLMINRNVITPYGLCKDSNKNGLVEVFTDGELKELRRAYNSNLYVDTFTFFLEKSGVRVSEGLALSVDDIDYRNNTILIRQSFVITEDPENDELVLIKKAVELGTTKSKNERVLDVPVSLIRQLKKYIEESNKNPLIKKGREESGLVFLTDEGKPQSYSGMLSRCLNLLEKANCDIKFGFHKYRHTYGTKLTEDGIESKLLQYYMGHKDIRTVYRYYISVTNKMRDNGKKIIESWDN